MNRLTSAQRKLVYAGGIIILLIPIYLLGEPASKRGPDDDEGSGGGQLSVMRSEYELGDSNLGDVDPSGATMNLVLVGLRGIAVNVLNMEALENQKTKNWAQMKANLESVILLQPHYIKVWEHQGWNIAYNVSASWDLIGDKYFWLKEGAKFTKRGADRNQKYPELYHKVGHILGDKLGRHDAWRYFRKFFNPAAYDQTDPLVGDPDIRRQSNGREIKPDQELNRDGRDNYLVAKDWYFRANEKEDRVPQHLMMREAFRAKPAQAQLGYAEALQREGRFDNVELMKNEWLIAFQEWTNLYQTGLGKGRTGFGREIFSSPVGKYMLAAEKKEDLEMLCQLDEPKGKFTPNDKKRVIESQCKTVNYYYWRKRSKVEREGRVVQAHRDVHDGKEALKTGNLQTAIDKLEQGLLAYAQTMTRDKELASEETWVEKPMIGILAWQEARKLRYNKAQPMEIPVFKQDAAASATLRSMWETQVKAGRIPELTRLLRYEFKVQE